ncbi:transcription factor ets-4-like isoform X2 [Penaeus chinensis]|uniref:transcription factor ets-4-like isoform X2 n=1 Tax=Penaeus chinensis TaxID=139456 RepID=UPI001FB6D306|nr:transcription factor ets-4-like isoform X2 [Penaeus chinensis]
MHLLQLYSCLRRDLSCCLQYYMLEPDMYLQCRVDEWQSEHVKSWLLAVCTNFGVSPEICNINAFSMYTGFQLRNMSLHDFCGIDRQHGELFHTQLHTYLRSELGRAVQYPTLTTEDSTYTVLQPRRSSPPASSFSPVGSFSPAGSFSTVGFNTWPQGNANTHSASFIHLTTAGFSDSDFSRGGEEFEDINSNDVESCTWYEIDNLSPLPETPEGIDEASRSPEERRRRRRETGPKVWQFLWELLHDPSCNPSLIRWENQLEFCFRLVKPHELARRWGQRRRAANSLPYDYFARCVRYHYQTGYLVSVPERKLVYKFGSKAIVKFEHANVENPSGL